MPSLSCKIYVHVSVLLISVVNQCSNDAIGKICTYVGIDKARCDW